jgi:hypothetical protein
MKKLLMLTLLIYSVTAGSGYAGRSQSVTAQAETPATTAPTPAPVEQPATIPAIESTPIPTVAPTQQLATEPTPTRAPAESKTATAPSAGFMAQQLSHKDFATMDLKECAKCHKGSGIAPTHGTDQLREHGFLARRADKNCVDCHNQQFCLDCHKGGGIDADLKISNYRTSYIPSSHRTDFREIHPIKALDNPQTCTKCHDARYCTQCHAKFRGEDLRVQSHRRGWSDLQTSSPGPAHSTFNTSQCQTCHPGGVLPKYVWSADHSREARRNLQACQTCHSDGAVCMTCHSARTGLRVNPHPRNWSAVKDRYRSKSGGRSCIKCHDNF